MQRTSAGNTRSYDGNHLWDGVCHIVGFRGLLSKHKQGEKIMFELPTLGQAAQFIFLMTLIYWAIKTTHDESEKRKIRHKEEKALIADMTFLTTTRVKFERHLGMLLDYVASYKLQRIIITDEKEIPQSVLLPYAEYKILQECYDKEEAKELAPLIEERIRNNANKNDFISHEEMMKFIDEKRARKNTEEKS